MGGLVDDWKRDEVVRGWPEWMAGVVGGVDERTGMPCALVFVEVSEMAERGVL